ncbi:P-loop containing nucleoside triphosphate hydrolase protein [Auriculariales sp. MPI-PUGE-AT-0066]|nr:P-loop containing nucleoside triphosphate hydrolase protein [Auriculariales sp. MPI-PUGE-AT-0066]
MRTILRASLLTSIKGRWRPLKFWTRTISPGSHSVHSLQATDILQSQNGSSPPPPHHHSAVDPITAKTNLSGSSYAIDRRKLLMLLARLHSTGIQKMFNVNLPQIAVVGSQSVGKSSLIEAISGIKLPRDSGTCTRCPMECRLEYTEGNEWTCSVSLRVADGAGQRDITFGSILTNPNDVERRLRQAQRALLRPDLVPTLFLTDSDLHIAQGAPPQSFTDDCVSVHIRGPDVTDLHFFDLPGIIVNVQDGQDPGDIDLVSNMVKRYISKPGCIVLLVVSCETDFENQLAGRIVKEIDPTGKNTVGVLTKPDKTDADQTREVQLINQKYPLRSNWYLLKLPSSDQLRAGISRAEARASADRFFLTNELWRDFVQRNASRVGTANLTEYLAHRLSDQLREELPRIRHAVSQMLLATTRDLAALPAELHSEPTAEVFTRVSQFAADVSLYIDGNAPLDPDRRGLVQQLLAPATSDRLPGPEGASLDELDADGDSYTTRTTNAVRIEQVMHTAKEARTRELPGNVPFAVKKHYIVLFLATWDAPTSRCFDKSLTIFTEELDRIVLKHFGRYAHGSLLEVVRGAVAAHILDIAKIAKQGLGLAVLRERELIITQSDHYLSAYKAKFLAHYRAARTRQVPSPSPSPVYTPNTLARQRPVVPQGFSPAGIQDSEDDEILAALRRYSSSYNNVTAADLPKLLPTDGMEPAIDIMAEVRAYFQVAYKRFADSIPQFIEQALIRAVNAGMSNALQEGLGLFEPNTRQRCAAWVAEPPAIADKRRELVANQVALINAQRELQRFG